jgi:conserved oligomeric Golgi complex subunit 4
MPHSALKTFTSPGMEEKGAMSSENFIGENDGTGDEVDRATSITEVQNLLSQLRSREAAVSSQLDDLVSSHQDFQRELSRLDILRAGVSTHAAKTRSISKGMVSNAAATAGKLSSSVRRLDLEQSRVKATLEVVDQVAELKACVLGVVGSMGAPQDWETAASYLSRASKIPDEIISGAFAARIVPTAEVPDAPSITLENASESLCGLFQREFERAVADNEGVRITRFFKLFPLIGRSDVGLDLYGRYVCQGVAGRARANLNAGTGGNQSKDGFFYANALTKLFEHIAQIIDGHGKLIERHYGSGSTIRVIERLQGEADRQGGIILDTWADDRQVDRKLTDVKSYAYTFLVQSFLPAPRGSSGTPRSSSPANFPSSRPSEDEGGADMKEVDALLNEMTVMMGKWSIYKRFVTEKCSKTSSTDGSVELQMFITDSTFAKKVADRLLSPFNAMTTFYFRRSIEKAFQLDEQPSDLSLNPQKPLKSNPPHISSAVDDIMYIVKKVLQQSLATSQSNVVTSVVPMLARVMGSDFIGMIQRKMRDESYPKAAVQGALPPEHTIVAFIILVNDLDVALQYIQQIIGAHTRASETPESEADGPVESRFPLMQEAESVKRALQSFNTTFESRATELLNDGIQVMFNNVMKPRLRPILLDAFRDVEYQLTKEELHELAHEEGREDGEEGEIVRRRFQHGWDALTRPIGRIMTEKAFDRLLTLIVSYLSKLLEKKIWSYHGRLNQLGAVRLERDINNVAATVVLGKKYVYRNAFLKCSQICMVMNMEEDEWEEMQSHPDEQGEIADRLGPDERARARAMIEEVD